MTSHPHTTTIRVSRIIPAPPAEVYDGWLDPKIPGNPWNAAEKFILNPVVDGLFYWTLKGTAHYGRFTTLHRGARIVHTWVSPNTSGLESTVTVTFEPQGTDTLMTLAHSDLPHTNEARGHERGWTYFLGIYGEQFGSGSRKPYRWDEAHPSANS
jgi:uncharacterized protein YndB with AHSA1/START domain